MKYNINEADFNKLDAAFQGEYKAEGDGYVLTVEGGEDTGALKRAKDHEKIARQKAETDLADTKKKLVAKEDELIEIRKGAIPKDDMNALEKSWKEKLDNQRNDLQGKLDTSNSALKNVFVDSVANKLAGEISTVPELMANQIKQRLAAETVDGKTVTRVLDADGKPSALTIEDFKKEILANPTYAPILVGSKASGGGAQGGGSNGSATKLKDMNEGDRVKLYRENPDEYRKLRDADKVSA